MRIYGCPSSQAGHIMLAVKLKEVIIALEKGIDLGT
jgi:hypothetical protein